MIGIHKQGFPEDFPQEKAVKIAIAAAKREHGGEVASTEVVHTPDLEAAGEYIVKIVLE